MNSFAHFVQTQTGQTKLQVASGDLLQLAEKYLKERDLMEGHDAPTAFLFLAYNGDKMLQYVRAEGQEVSDGGRLMQLFKGAHKLRN